MNLTPRSWKILNKERDGRLAKLKAEGPSSGLRSIFFQTPEEIVREASGPLLLPLIAARKAANVRHALIEEQGLRI